MVKLKIYLILKHVRNPGQNSGRDLTHRLRSLLMGKMRKDGHDIMTQRH